MRKPQKNDVVLIMDGTTANNGLFATVLEEYDWGCKVEHRSKDSSNPQKEWHFRLDWEEMIYIGTLPTVFDPSKPPTVVMLPPGVSKETAEHVLQATKTVRPGEPGYRKFVDERGEAMRKSQPAVYEGFPCPQCQALMLKRTGPCLTCDNCGHNTGC